MGVSGYMIHGDLSAINWHLSLAGAVAGLVAWSLLAGVTGCLVVLVYNRLLLLRDPVPGEFANQAAIDFSHIVFHILSGSPIARTLQAV